MPSTSGQVLLVAVDNRDHGVGGHPGTTFDEPAVRQFGKRTRDVRNFRIVQAVLADHPVLPCRNAPDQPRQQALGMGCQGHDPLAEVPLLTGEDVRVAL